MTMAERSKTLIKFLKTKKIAIIGYGSQGRAQALNLRDSGVIPIIGLPASSKSRKIAKKDGLEVISPREAIEIANIAVILIPDHKHQELFEDLKRPGKLAGKALIFAHGFSVTFKTVRLPRECDIILVAPHGPGLRLREKYLDSEPFTAFVGIYQNYSGEALKIARAYAAAIGIPAKFLFKSSFKDEAIGDIFGEQAVLCGGLVGLMESGVETLIKKGLSSESAYLECIYQLDLIVDLIKKYGPAGMFERISKTAAFGSLKNKNRLFDRQMKQKMEVLYSEIKSGKFAKALSSESKKGMKNFNRDLNNYKKSVLQKTHILLTKKLKNRD